MPLAVTHILTLSLRSPLIFLDFCRIIITDQFITAKIWYMIFPVWVLSPHMQSLRFLSLAFLSHFKKTTHNLDIKSTKPTTIWEIPHLFVSAWNDLLPDVSMTPSYILFSLRLTCPLFRMTCPNLSIEKLSVLSLAVHLLYFSYFYSLVYNICL